MSSQPVDIPDLPTRHAVAELLDVELRRLAWLAYVLPRDRAYKSFPIERRSGGVRTISAPIKPLKEVQRGLAISLLDGYRRPAHVHGFARGRSPVTNATVHVGKFNLLRVDIQDFFPTITFFRVRGLFRAWPFEYPRDVADLLARLCCAGNSLPQGAPTSPIVSNFICRRMDRQLAALAAAHRCHFTRYADDLCFSTSQHTFPPGLGQLIDGSAVVGDDLEAVVRRNGFAINHAKTTLAQRFQRQRVTGIVVNEKTNVPREYVRGLRSLLYVWDSYGREAAIASMRRHAAPTANRPDGKPLPRFEEIVRGRVQYVGAVKGERHPVYVKLAQKLSEVDPEFSPPPPPILEAKIYTEGPCDWRHLLAAQSHFHQQGEFLDFVLSTGPEPAREGDTQLRKFAEQLAMKQQDEFHLCIFDSDTKKAKDAVGPDGHKRYAPRVIALGLAAPPWRDPREPLFIEHLFTEEVLRTPLDNGRRMYVRNEFDPDTGHHRHGGRCSIPIAKSDKYLQTEVHQFDTGLRISPSKLEFAEAVQRSPEHFGTGIFDGFRPTFDRIGEALREAWRELD